MVRSWTFPRSNALGAKHFDFHRLRVTGRAAAEPPSNEAPDAASTEPSETETDAASGPRTTT
jgi:hypothetical protein